MAGFEVITEVKMPSPSALKVKMLGRNERRIARRAAIKRIRNKILALTGREPTIAEVQGRLEPLGLRASVRIVWLDLNYLRTR